ncbi:hypothetical protein BCR42DRAFT_476115 [Absidia repens]|uniref:Uncharacterized protein n=1 Tax=Absidia repens TaxID=90262 RepID=A0A1X2IQM0_9FUNG|nr:hypothetical protein BCR42DRAFT_476115 [Absidia repens]
MSIDSATKFIALYCSNGDLHQVPNLFYNYSPFAIKIYNSHQHNNCISEVTASNLAAIIHEERVSIKNVLESTYMGTPILIIVSTAFNALGSHLVLFWHNVLESTTTQIYFDIHMADDFSAITVTATPLKKPFFTLFEIRNDMNNISDDGCSRYLLVFGKRDRSLQAVMLDVNSDKQHVQGQVTHLCLSPQLLGHATALYILPPQEPCDWEEVCDDPRLVVGTSAGHINIWRLSLAIFKRQQGMNYTHILSPSTVDYSKHINERISHINCVCISRSHKIVTIIGQNLTPSLEGTFGNSNVHACIIERRSDYSRTVSERLVPVKLVSYTLLSTHIMAIKSIYHIIALFQSTLNHQDYEVDIWSMKERNIELLVSDQITGDNFQDVWPVQELLQYILLSPTGITKYGSSTTVRLPSQQTHLATESNTPPNSALMNITNQTDVSNSSLEQQSTKTNRRLDDLKENHWIAANNECHPSKTATRVVSSTLLPALEEIGGARISSLKLEYASKLRQIVTSIPLPDMASIVRNDNTSILSQQERLYVLFDIILLKSITALPLSPSSSRRLDIDNLVSTLKGLGLNIVERKWLMFYCYNHQYPLLKLVIMRYNIEFKEYGLVLLQGRMMSMEKIDNNNDKNSSLTSSINRTCRNLVTLAETMVPQILQDMPLEFFGQSKGNYGNPFLYGQVTSLSIKEKELCWGGELINQVIASRKRRRLGMQ